MFKTSSALIGAALAAVTVLMPAAAHAEKPASDTFELVCGDAGTFVITTANGNGEFTPAHVVGSSSTFIPVAFSGFHFIATASDGTVLVDEIDNEAASKGKVAEHNPREQVTCTFGATEVLTEEADGFPAGTTLSFSGGVTGYFSPKAK